MGYRTKQDHARFAGFPSRVTLNIDFYAVSHGWPPDTAAPTGVTIITTTCDGYCCE
jgi:hypothetical protein